MFITLTWATNQSGGSLLPVWDRAPTCLRLPVMLRRGRVHAESPLAQEIDAAHHGGMPPYAELLRPDDSVLHSLAFNDRLKGLSSRQLRYSVLAPGTDISFIDDARKRFVAGSAYLDDRPGAPSRFFGRSQPEPDRSARRTKRGCRRRRVPS